MNFFYELSKEQSVTQNNTNDNLNYSEKNGRFDSVIKCLKVKTQAESNLLNKPIGTHYVIECKTFSPYEKKTHSYISGEIAKITRELIDNFDKKAKRFLIVGIGNEGIISDALGPKTIDNVIVTRNIVKSKTFPEVSTISPSVFAKTGIESAETIKNICDIVKPDIVILVDVLTCNNLRHLGVAFQVTTSGLSPGAGVKNFQKSIDKNFLKVPVITLGSPLMISYEKMFMELFDKNYQETKKTEPARKLVEVAENIYTIETEKKSKTNDVVNSKDFKEKCKLYKDKYFVEKDIEFFVEKISNILSFAINKALFVNLSDKEIESFL